MGRIVELLVAVNAAGGIAVTVVYFKQKAARQRRKEQAERASQEVEKLRQMK